MTDFIVLCCRFKVSTFNIMVNKAPKLNAKYTAVFKNNAFKYFLAHIICYLMSIKIFCVDVTAKQLLSTYPDPDY